MEDLERRIAKLEKEKTALITFNHFSKRLFHSLIYNEDSKLIDINKKINDLGIMKKKAENKIKFRGKEEEEKKVLTTEEQFIKDNLKYILSYNNKKQPTHTSMMNDPPGLSSLFIEKYSNGPIKTFINDKFDYNQKSYDNGIYLDAKTKLTKPHWYVPDGINKSIKDKVEVVKETLKQVSKRFKNITFEVVNELTKDVDLLITGCPRILNTYVGLAMMGTNYTYRMDGSKKVITLGNTINQIFIETETIMTRDGSFKQILLHEIGHFLGISHPFEGDHVNNTIGTNDTLMSYHWEGDNKTEFQKLDVAAINSLWKIQPNLALNTLYIKKKVVPLRIYDIIRNKNRQINIFINNKYTVNSNEDADLKAELESRGDDTDNRNIIAINENEKSIVAELLEKINNTFLITFEFKIVDEFGIADLVITVAKKAKTVAGPLEKLGKFMHASKGGVVDGDPPIISKSIIYLFEDTFEDVDTSKHVLLYQMGHFLGLKTPHSGDNTNTTGKLKTTETVMSWTYDETQTDFTLLDKRAIKEIWEEAMAAYGITRNAPGNNEE
jgi:predicted Zn-dependent protease with MMP-like domain